MFDVVRARSIYMPAVSAVLSVHDLLQFLYICVIAHRAPLCSCRRAIAGRAAVCYAPLRQLDSTEVGLRVFSHCFPQKLSTLRSCCLLCVLFFFSVLVSRLASTPGFLLICRRRLAISSGKGKKGCVALAEQRGCDDAMRV